MAYEDIIFFIFYFVFEKMILIEDDFGVNCLELSSGLVADSYD